MAGILCERDTVCLSSRQDDLSSQVIHSAIGKHSKRWILRSYRDWETIRRVQALIGITGRKACAGGYVRQM